jgi:hypothetical protein
METKSPIHLLLRFSDTLLKEGDTIGEHNQVVSREGAVWFGKMGSPVSQHHIDLFNKQVEDGIPTYVYLVKGNRRKSIAYRCRLIAAARSLPENEKHLMPSYYNDLDLTKYMKFWVKLSDLIPISFDDLSKMRVASSVLPIRETLIKSATGHFFLVENKGLFA